MQTAKVSNRTRPKLKESPTSNNRIHRGFKIEKLARFLLLTHLPNPILKSGYFSKRFLRHLNQWLDSYAPLHSLKIDIKLLFCPHCPIQPLQACALECKRGKRKCWIKRTRNFTNKNR